MDGALRFALIVVVQLILPASFIYAVWRSRDDTRLGWCLKALYAATYIAAFFLVGRWDFFSYYLRYVMVGAFAVAALAGYRRAHGLPWSMRWANGGWVAIVSSLVMTAIFTAFIAMAARGFAYDGPPVRLSSPLRGGTFYVGQGGNHPLINYHNTHHAQRFALDIVELNRAGARAATPLTSDVRQFVIFGRSVHSPCDGRVVQTVDGLVDNPPPQRDRTHASGNHVVIACHGVRVLLAHLQSGTVAVADGATVADGDVVGRVGNSGNTTEPHLHIHAVRDDGDAAADPTSGDPAPMLLDDVFAVRNTLLRDSER